jgi:hypothetical protein
MPEPATPADQTQHFADLCRLEVTCVVARVFTADDDPAGGPPAEVQP